MHNSNFLAQFEIPIVALSPMDGVTDAPFRYITKKYSNPDIIFTEFTHVQGLCVAGDKLLHHFIYDESERIVIAQIYGKEPEYFYHAAKIVAALGFDGVDINMGCPSKNVATSGSGAGLIRTPQLALEIILAVKEGVNHWVQNGKVTGLSNRTEKAFFEQIEKQYSNISISSTETSGKGNLRSYKDKNVQRNKIPVSVKTRIGYSEPDTENWIKTLNKAKPEWISLHGRTLKQMYSGISNWNEIAKAVKVSEVPVLANGDIKNIGDAKSALEVTNASGVLVGRATFGDPFLITYIKSSLTQSSKLTMTPQFSKQKRFEIIVEHAKKFVEIYPDPKAFFMMRKHFGWYCSGFDGALDLRKKLMQVSSISDLLAVLNQ